MSTTTSTSTTTTTIVFPGDTVPAQHVNLKLGPGLLQVSSGSGSSSNNIAKGKDGNGKDGSGKGKENKTEVIATRAGELHCSKNKSRWWVESNARRYVPAPQEQVIGTIVQKVGEGYRVDIGAAHLASLDALAFEGATKRNRPNLKVGSLVYARVSLAHKDMDPELECFDAQTRKAEGYGELKGGFVVRCSLKMCRDLLDPTHFLLPLLGGRFPLEAAVGINGRVWVSAKEVKQTIAIVRCIEAADPDGGGLGVEGIKGFLNTLEV